MFRTRLVSAICLLLAGPFALAGGHHNQLNLTKGATPLAHDIYDLHMTILWICVAIGMLVFSIMLYSMVRHRKSRGAQASEFHESTIVELLWTIVPFFILLGMAIPATKVLIKMYNTDDAAVNCKKLQVINGSGNMNILMKVSTFLAT